MTLSDERRAEIGELVETGELIVVEDDVLRSFIIELLAEIDRLNEVAQHATYQWNLHATVGDKRYNALSAALDLESPDVANRVRGYAQRLNMGERGLPELQATPTPR